MFLCKFSFQNYVLFLWKIQNQFDKNKCIYRVLKIPEIQKFSGFWKKAPEFLRISGFSGISQFKKRKKSFKDWASNTLTKEIQLFFLHRMICYKGYFWQDIRKYQPKQNRKIFVTFKGKFSSLGGWEKKILTRRKTQFH